MNHPRGYYDALQNTKKALTMVDKREMEGDTIETVDWARPLAFQDSCQKITRSTQTVAPTYLTDGTVLEFVYLLIYLFKSLFTVGMQK